MLCAVSLTMMGVVFATLGIPVQGHSRNFCNPQKTLDIIQRVMTCDKRDNNRHGEIFVLLLFSYFYLFVSPCYIHFILKVARGNLYVRLSHNTSCWDQSSSFNTRLSNTWTSTWLLDIIMHCFNFDRALTRNILQANIYIPYNFMQDHQRWYNVLGIHIICRVLYTDNCHQNVA